MAPIPSTQDAHTLLLTSARSASQLGLRHAAPMPASLFVLSVVVLLVLLNETHARWLHFTGLHISSNIIRSGLTLLLSMCHLEQIDQSSVSQCGSQCL